MYFSINSAFNHYMSSFDFSSQNQSSPQLLPYEPTFDIFLNKSYILVSMHPSSIDYLQLCSGYSFSMVPNSTC